MHVRASRVPTSDQRTVFFAPNLIASGQSGSSFPIPILLDCSPFSASILLHLSGQAFRVRFHSTSINPLHSAPRTGRRGPNHVPILQKMAEIWRIVVNGLSTPKRPQRCFVFTKPQVTRFTGGRNNAFPIVHNRKFVPKVDNSDQISSKTKLFKRVCKIVCVSPLKGQRLRRRSSPAQGAGHADGRGMARGGLETTVTRRKKGDPPPSARGGRHHGGSSRRRPPRRRRRPCARCSGR